MVPIGAYVAVSAILFVIAIAAGEAAVGLAIIIVVFRGKIATNVDQINLLKW